MGYDIEPGVTTKYKEKFYKVIMQEKLKMIFEHDDEIIGGELAIDERNKYSLVSPILSTMQLSQKLD